MNSRPSSRVTMVVDDHEINATIFSINLPEPTIIHVAQIEESAKREKHRHM